jgi:hypothetical protein
MGTTTIRMAGGATCIKNASDTSSTALLTFEGLSNSRHTGSHYTQLILKLGTIYMTIQTPILLYDM